jgi:hypothetical protein
MYHERALEKCGFWKKTKKQIWKKSEKSKKKIYEKSWTATAFVSKRPKEKARAFLPPRPPSFSVPTYRLT